MYRARKIADPSLTVALKHICKRRLSQNEARTLAHEFEILRVLRHPNLVRYFDVFESPIEICYVAEMCRGKTLFDVVAMSPRGRLSEKFAIEILRVLLEAVEYIHAAGIVHRDLKPENILLETSVDQQRVLSLKIIDFGFADYVEHAREQRLICGTIYYMAPESLRGEVSYKADVYALGIIFFFMLTGTLPFTDKDPKLVARCIETISSASFENPLLSATSKEATGLLLQMTRRI